MTISRLNQEFYSLYDVQFIIIDYYLSYQNTLSF